MKQTQYLFYGSDNTYSSAKIIYPELKKYLPKINSIIDIGCGMASFAKAFQDDGVDEIKLIDHPALEISKLLLQSNFEFIPCDIDKFLPPQIKADLTICTEVLEHIKLSRSLEILDFITSCSDLIIFSAAIPRQGGIGHINEQRHGFWIEEFKKRGFDYCDAFKVNTIKNQKILYWLNQNLFIFFKNQPHNSPLIDSKLLNTNFELVSSDILNKSFGFFEVLKMLPQSFIKSLLKRF